MGALVLHPSQPDLPSALGEAGLREGTLKVPTTSTRATAARCIARPRLRGLVLDPTRAEDKRQKGYRWVEAPSFLC